MSPQMRSLWHCGSQALISSSRFYVGFDPSFVGYQFEEQVGWIQGAGISYHLGGWH